MQAIPSSSRLLSILASRGRLCPYSLRLFTSSSSAESGHSRWSKIKHDKAKVDAGRTKIRSNLCRQIKAASQTGGPDPQQNLRLGALLLEAKKADLPKAVVENAIKRGQGISLSGAPLESFLVEFMLPPSVAGILEVETDSRGRTIQDLKYLLKEQGATITPCSYMFDKRGKLVYAAKEGQTEEHVLESAIDAGALDVETDEEEGHIVWTEPSETSAVAASLKISLGSEAKSQDLVFVPKEDAKVDWWGDECEELMSKLQDFPEVQGTHLNTTGGG